MTSVLCSRRCGRRVHLPSSARVPPHLPLGPPVRGGVDAFGAVSAPRRGACALAVDPSPVARGPAVTFHPVNPVVYLEVSGDGVEDVRALRDRMASGPLA